MDTSSAEFQAALRDHAKSLGVDPDGESYLLELVQEALLAELPTGWEQGETEDGTLYYFNTNTEESIWEHPLDAHYRELIQTKKQEHTAAAPAASKPESAVSAAKAEPVQETTAVSSVEVYSFDECSDDELDARAKSRQTTITTTAKTSTSTSSTQDRSSRLNALFGAESTTTSLNRGNSTAASSNLASSFGSASQNASTSLLGSKGTGASTASGSTTGGFGRDRSWLLDGSDDEGDVFGKKPVSSLLGSKDMRPATASSLASGTPLTTTNTNSPYSFLSRGDTRPGTSSSTTPATSNSSALDMMLNASGASSQKSPILGAASASVASSSPPRRAIGTTVKTQLFSSDSQSSSGGAPLAAAGMSSLLGTSDASITSSFTSGRVEQLEKQVATLTTENESLKKSLERAQQDAKEVNYLKMKANEAKSKLADKESELAELRATLKKEKDALADAQRKFDQQKSQQHQTSSSEVASSKERETRLEMEKDSLNETVRKLQHDLEEAKKQVNDTNKQLREVEKQLTETNKLLEDSKAQLDESRKLLAGANADSKKGIEDIRAAREAETNAKHALSIANEAVTQAQVSLKSKEQAWKAQEDALNQKIKTYTQELDSLRDKLELAGKSRQQELEDARDASLKAQLRVKELERQVESERCKGEEASAATIRDLKRDLESKSRLLADTEERMKSLEKQAQTAQVELIELRDKLEAIQQQRSALELQHRREKQQREEFQAKVAQIESQQVLEKREREERLQREKELTHESTSKLEAQVRELNAQVVQLKSRELAPLTAQREALERERDGLNERVASLDRALRASQLESTTRENAVSQLQRELELLQRRSQQTRGQLETLVSQKEAGEQQIAALEAELATARHDKRSESDKLAFKLRELESQLAHRDYEVARIEEKFAAAEAWRAKEARRVQDRDAELVDVREQLAQLKARNVEAENSAVIAELRRIKSDLEHELESTRGELERARAEVASQLPELARACVARTSDEWSKKLRESVAKVKQQWRLEATSERNTLIARAQRAEEARDAAERKLKDVVAESEFLRKEVRRIEDGNKELLDQLHTIRVYMTSYPRGSQHVGGCTGHTGVTSSGTSAPSNQPQPPPQSHAVPPPPPAPPAPMPASSPPPSLWGEAAAVGHLNAQLGILHAQFQQLLDSNDRWRRPTVVTSYSPSFGFSPAPVSPYSPSDRFEIPSSPRHSTTETKAETTPTSEDVEDTVKALCPIRRQQQEREKEELLASLEALGSPPPLNAMDCAAALPDASTAWYQPDYWRRKYNTY